MRALIYRELRETWIIPVGALAAIGVLTLP